MDGTPDYDASDELEYGLAALAWLARGNEFRLPTTGPGSVSMQP